MLRSILQQSSHIGRRFFSLSSTCRVLPIEPSYLDTDEPAIGEYELINVQVKGYDFTVVERYARYVHRIALQMDLDVEECWATPHVEHEVRIIKPRTEVVEEKYTLKTYERNVQIADLSATTAPIFMEMAQAALPVGVKLSFHPHNESYTKLRYLVDSELKEKRKELEGLAHPTKKKKAFTAK